MQPEIYHLTSGLTRLFLPNPGSQAVHVAVLVNTGTRDETPELNGISHFIEHMVFKGTDKRKAYHILNRLDSVGGEVNAYTTKEQTCYYASVATEHAERAVELLADIILNSNFPEAEIVKEKNVIAEEIDMYQDYPEETILEDFEAKLFPGHALSKPILGTHETLQNLSRKEILTHHTKWYTPENIAVGICGNLESDTAAHLVEKYFGHLKPKAKAQTLKAKTNARLFTQNIVKSLQQSHVLMGGKAPSRNQTEQWALQLLVNLLGGPAMNSRLNLSIREKHGLVYQISCMYSAYEDAGFTGIYFSADEKKREKVVHLVLDELRKICISGISEDALQKAIRQMCGNIRLQHDSKQNMLHYYLKESFQKSLLSTDDFIRHIQQVKAQEIQTVAQKYLNPDKLSYINYIPGQE